MQLLILAAEDEPNPIIPHAAELVVGLVAFLLLLFFLQRFAFPLFERTFQARRDAIEGGIERAERAQAEAQRAYEEYKAQLADARGEAARIREEARGQGGAILEEMRQQAREEADRIVARAHDQIRAEHEQALAQLRTEVGTLSVQLASRIVGESLEDEARRRRTVERFLADLEQEPARDSADRVPVGQPASQGGATDRADAGQPAGDASGGAGGSVRATSGPDQS